MTPASVTLEILFEPALVVLRRGDILAANGPARRLFAAPLETGDLYDWVLSPRAELDAFLRRAGGATAPLVGAVMLDTPQGPAAFRLHGARLRRGDRDAGAPPQVALRLIASDHDPLVMLQRRVRELDAQLSRRRAENLALDAALLRNQALVQELQHRVKNTIQLILTLLAQSSRGRETPEVAAVVEAASLRLQALASAQEALYRSPRPGWAAAETVFAELLPGIEARLGAAGRIRAEIAAAELPEAQVHALALAVSELVTNALRHGGRGPDAPVRVTLSPVEGGLRLEVTDDGPGLGAPPAGPGAGLELARRLAAQIGGELELAGPPGATWRLRFAVPSA